MTETTGQGSNYRTGLIETAQEKVGVILLVSAR